MPTLEDAVALAAQAHRGQVDKAGQPYILHPLRVMLRVAGDDARMAAVLHDVVEDTEWTPARLRAAGYPEAVVRAVEHLTRGAGETYPEFIARAATDAVAREVKLADLADNMDVRRLGEVTAKDEERLARYRAAWRQLTDAPLPCTR
ncbi:MAG: HD domain-containing protein [Rhodospirillales bacterium]|nr:MAG: HD domain-containing protein [Rhodospirillales bacterium]